MPGLNIIHVFVLELVEEVWVEIISYGQAGIPLMLIHGGADPLVPLGHSMDLELTLPGLVWIEVGSEKGFVCCGSRSKLLSITSAIKPFHLAFSSMRQKRPLVSLIHMKHPLLDCCRTAGGAEARELQVKMFIPAHTMPSCSQGLDWMQHFLDAMDLWKDIRHYSLLFAQMAIDKKVIYEKYGQG